MPSPNRLPADRRRKYFPYNPIASAKKAAGAIFLNPLSSPIRSACLCAGITKLNHTRRVDGGFLFMISPLCAASVSSVKYAKLRASPPNQIDNC